MKTFIVIESIIDFSQNKHACKVANVCIFKDEATGLMRDLYYSFRENNNLEIGSSRVNCDVRIDNLYQIDYDNYMRYSVQIDEVEL